MKFYAVRKGRVPGIYHTWKECQEQVQGFSGAEFKSFTSKADAKGYMGAKKSDDSEPTEIQNYDLVAYVDGSCLSDGTAYSSGVAIFDNSGILRILEAFKGTSPDYVTMRNVAGEILAASRAINYALQNKINNLLICYDYEGIEKWCSGDWEARKTATIRYRELYLLATQEGLTIQFKKIKSHSNHALNDLADILAKSALSMASSDEVISALVKGIQGEHNPDGYLGLAKLLTEKTPEVITNTEIYSDYMLIYSKLAVPVTYTM